MSLDEAIAYLRRPCGKCGDSLMLNDPSNRHSYWAVKGAGIETTCFGERVANVMAIEGDPEVHVFGCGCQADQATGLPISTCRRHDQRTREVKASAAFMQMANCMDEAHKPCADTAAWMSDAARYAVKAAKALIGSETE